MANKKTSPVWREFEKAVAAFLQALDPNAKIVHDVSIPDKDTGSPRQRDVWIDSVVAGFNIRIYVSCKDYKKKIDQQDMDAVIGELASSGAHKGVIFAKNGFTEDAKKKAQVHDIDCCILIDDKTIELPEELNLDFYARRGRVSFNFGIQNRKDQIAFIASKSLNPKSRVVAVLAKELNRLVQQSSNNDHISVSSEISIESSANNKPVQVKLHHAWEYYKAQLNNKLIKGSYNFNQKQFNGTVTSPVINTSGPDLGDSWTKIEGPSENPNNIMIQIEPNYVQFWKSLKKEDGWKYASEADPKIFDQ